MKRFLDIVASALLLIALLPFFIIIALLIVVTDGRPVFFKQDRMGKGCKLFKLYKFRTMSVLKSAEKGSFDAGNNLRVTSIGAILRKSKMDELPQLLNVLFGDMSVVGPRPEVEKWTKVYPERWNKVLAVRPGITDNASIEFRNEEELLNKSSNPEELYKNEILPKKLDLYEKYIEENSVVSDFLILLRTFIALLNISEKDNE